MILVSVVCTRNRVDLQTWDQQRMAKMQTHSSWKHSLVRNAAGQKPAWMQDNTSIPNEALKCRFDGPQVLLWHIRCTAYWQGIGLTYVRVFPNFRISVNSIHIYSNKSTYKFNMMYLFIYWLICPLVCFYPYKPGGRVLPSMKVMGLVRVLAISGTGGYRRSDSLMHIVVYGILLRSSLWWKKQRLENIREWK